MKTITMHMVRDTLGFKGPMSLKDLASYFQCPILDVAVPLNKALTLRLIERVGALYSTHWKG